MNIAPYSLPLSFRHKPANHCLPHNMKRKLKGVENGEEFDLNSMGQFDCDDDLKVKMSKNHGVPQGLITCTRNESSYLSFLLMKKTLLPQRNDGSPQTEWKGIMDIVHVFVPEASRGLKVAERLARKAFSVAAEKEWIVRASCTYVRNTFLIRCPYYRVQTLHIEKQDLDRNCTFDNVIGHTNANSHTTSKRRVKSTELHVLGQLDRAV